MQTPGSANAAAELRLACWSSFGKEYAWAEGASPGAYAGSGLVIKVWSASFQPR